MDEVEVLSPNNDIMSGRGILTFPDGSWYDGEYHGTIYN